MAVTALPSAWPFDAFITAPTSAPTALSSPAAVLLPRRRRWRRSRRRPAPRAPTVSIASKPFAAAIAAGVAAAVGDELGEHLLGLRRRQRAADLQRRQRGEVGGRHGRLGALLGERLLDVDERPRRRRRRRRRRRARSRPGRARRRRHGLAVGGRAGGRGQRCAAGGRQHRQRRRGPRSIHAGVGLERHEVGLEEVAVVVGVLLRAQRVRAAVVLVPVPGLLAHRLAGLDAGRSGGAPRTRWPGRASAPS